MKCFGFLIINSSSHHLLKTADPWTCTCDCDVQTTQPAAGCTLLFPLLRTKAASFCQTQTQHGFLPPLPCPWHAQLLQRPSGLFNFQVLQEPDGPVQSAVKLALMCFFGGCPNQVICSFLSPGNTKSIPFLWLSSLGTAEWSQLVLPEKSKVWEGREMPFQPCRHP